MNGSSLFNIADFFQSKECASHFGGLYYAGSLHSDKQVIEDSLGANGDVQLALAAFLKEFAGQDAHFYVDAQNEDVKNLFKYGDSEYSEEILYHFNSNGGEDEKCLVYSADASGNLLTKAVNCDEKHRPLCLNINKDNLQLFSDSCSNCPSQGVNVCKEWVDLADYNNDNNVVNGAHLCVKPCAKVQSTQADKWCRGLNVEDLGSETSANLFSYKSFVNSITDVENYLDGKYVDGDGSIICGDELCGSGECGSGECEIVDDIVDYYTTTEPTTETEIGTTEPTTETEAPVSRSVESTDLPEMENEGFLPQNIVYTTKPQEKLFGNIPTGVSIQKKILEHLKLVSPTVERNVLFQNIQSLFGSKSPANLLNKFLTSENKMGLDIWTWTWKRSFKKIRQAVEGLIKQYLPANIESNNGFIQNTLLTALNENTDETQNKFHINLEDNKSVNFTLPEGKITNSEEVKIFDELSVYFKLETIIVVNKVLDADPDDPTSTAFAWLWRFASEDLISLLTDLLQVQSDLLETLSPLELEHTFSFGLTQWSFGSQSYIGIGLGDPRLNIPIISLESNDIGTNFFAIEFSHIKVNCLFRKVLN